MLRSESQQARKREAFLRSSLIAWKLSTVPHKGTFLKVEILIEIFNEKQKKSAFQRKWNSQWVCHTPSFLFSIFFQDCDGCILGLGPCHLWSCWTFVLLSVISSNKGQPYTTKKNMILSSSLFLVPVIYAWKIWHGSQERSIFYMH